MGGGGGGGGGGEVISWALRKFNSESHCYVWIGIGQAALEE